MKADINSCHTCRWYSDTDNTSEPYCFSYQNVYVNKESHITYNLVSYNRNNNLRCGKQGNWWEPIKEHGDVK